MSGSAKNKAPVRKRKGEPAGDRLAPEDFARLLIGFDVRRVPPGLISLDVWVQNHLAPMAERLGAFIEREEPGQQGPMGPVGNPVRRLLTLRLNETLTAIEGAKFIRDGGQDFQHAERTARDMAMRLTGFIEGFGGALDCRSWEAAEARRTSGRRTALKVELAAEKYKHDMTREDAAEGIAEEVGLSCDTVQRMLSVQFPGGKWPFDLLPKDVRKDSV